MDMQSAPASSRPPVRLEPGALAVMRILGPDIFISYRKAEAAGYARRLRDDLEKLGYRCFLDEDWQPAGYDIELYRRVARRSRMFVLIGSRTVLQSAHVRQELEAYRDGHAGWLSRRWHRIFPISVAGSLAIFETADTCQEYRNTPWGALSGLVAEAETQEALASGIPSESIAQRIARTYGLLRGTRLLLLTSVLLAATILTVTLWTVADARKQLRKVSAAKSAAEHERDKAQSDAGSARTEASNARTIAEQETARAGRERVVADAYSLLGGALRLPETEWDGSLNFKRVLLGASSWKANPSAAAFEFVSGALATLPRRIAFFQTEIAVVHLAVDRSGELIAGSNKGTVVTWNRRGSAQWRKSVDADVQQLAFTADGKELLIATRSAFFRVSSVDGHEIKHWPLADRSFPKFSRDGEWVAFDEEGNNERIALMPTRNSGQKTIIAGKQACFADDLTVYVLRTSPEGKDQIVQRTLAGPTAGVFDDSVFTLPASSDGLTDCYFGTVISGATAYPLDALRKPVSIPGGVEFHLNGGNVMFVVISHISGGRLLKGVGAYLENGWKVMTYLPPGDTVRLAPREQAVIADAEEHSVSVWDCTDQRLIAKGQKAVELPRGALSGLRNWHRIWSNIVAAPNAKIVSPNGKWLFYADAKKISIVEAAEGNVVLTADYPNPQSFIPDYQRYLEAAFSEDGKSFALRDSQPRFWIWSLDPEYYYSSLCRSVSLLMDGKNSAGCPTTVRHLPQPFGQ